MWRAQTSIKLDGPGTGLRRRRTQDAAPATALHRRNQLTKRRAMDFSLLFDVVNGIPNNTDSGFNGCEIHVRVQQMRPREPRKTLDAQRGLSALLDVGFGQTIMWWARATAPHRGQVFEVAGPFFNVGFKPKVIPRSAGGCRQCWYHRPAVEVIRIECGLEYLLVAVFAWAILIHFGLRTLGSHRRTFTGGVQVGTGGTTSTINNAGKTVGLTEHDAWKKVTWFNNGLTLAPETITTTMEFVHLYDTDRVGNARQRAIYINFDMDQDKNIGSGTSKWTGIAGAFAGDRQRVCPVRRTHEFFDDLDGVLDGNLSRSLAEVYGYRRNTR